jgi:hypothetical protein
MRQLIRGAPRWALATTICVLAAAAAPARAATAPAVLTLEARNDDGGSTIALHAGETLILSGTLSPAVLGEAVVVSVVLDGGPLAAQTAVIGAVAPNGVGTFQAQLRPMRPGQLSVVARHAASPIAGEATSPPLAVAITAVGRSQPGCQGPATLARLDASRPPRVGDGPLRRGALLALGARVEIPGGTSVRLRRGTARYRSSGGRFTVECGALKLLSGRMRAVLDQDRGRARLLLGTALASVVGVGRLDVDARQRRMRFVRGRGLVTSSADPRSIMHTFDGDTVLVDWRGLARLNTWPFAKSPEQRRLKRGAVPPYWRDGAGCATGCRPAGALTGWPLKPFHKAHPLRSGLNEWRPANMHIGIDIQALDGTRVYAIQSGTAGIAGGGTVDIRVRVGSYEYWHVRPAVHAGQYVRAHRTVIGRVIRGAGHLHLSELRGGYLNPLRPGGRVLEPYRDTEEPVIGAPRASGGQLFVEAFDPQSLRETIKYRTPVLAPAAVAWRARDARGRALTPLYFAYRGSHHYPTGAKSLVYGPGTTPPNHVGAIAGGWACFWRFRICVPKWNYRLSGVPSGAASLSVYAWDWAGNVAVRTSSLHGARAAGAVSDAGADPLHTGPVPGRADISPID